MSKLEDISGDAIKAFSANFVLAYFCNMVIYTKIENFYNLVLNNSFSELDHSFLFYRVSAGREY